MGIFKKFALCLAKQTLAKSAVVTPPFVLLLLSVHNLVIGQTSVYRLGHNVELSCTASTNNDRYTWSDESVDPQVTIYFVDNDSSQEKSPGAAQKEKYDNFGIDNNYPGSVNLVIQSVEIEDESTYQCRLINVPSDTVSYEVHVEVPGNVSIKTELLDVKPLTVTVGMDYNITCTATGTRSRNKLSFVWEPPLNGGIPVQQPNGNLTDYTITSTYTPRKEDISITCQLTGYVLQDEIKDVISDSIRVIVQYKPECSLMVVSTDCKMVTLTCECTAVPEIQNYSFYNGSSLIESTVDKTIDVNVGYDTTSEFSCLAANIIGTGNTSNEEIHLCEEATTAPPKPTTQGSSSTPDPDGLHIAVIIVIVLVCLALIVIVVIVVVKCVVGGHSTDSHKPGDETSIDLENKETSQPEYAVPNKKKSNKPDGNGAGPENDLPTYAAVDKPQPTAAPRTSEKEPEPDGMELQYADLDHTGKPATNEIRIPQNEPTEYATVQSVIV